MNRTDKARAAILAKAITAICVRNGFLEDLHSGITPSSKAGDYSDVKVVTPFGEIPWEEVSRISDVEMKRLMKGIVNQVYMFLCRQDDPAFFESFVAMGSSYAARWDEPEATDDLIALDNTPTKEAESRSKRKRAGSVSRPSARRKRDE
jgi:hypothetical protein